MTVQGLSSGSTAQNTNWNWHWFWIPETWSIFYHCQSCSFHRWHSITYKEYLSYNKDSPLDLEKAHLQVTLDIAGICVCSHLFSHYTPSCASLYIDGIALVWYKCSPICTFQVSTVNDMTYLVMSYTVIRPLFIKSRIASTSSSKIMIAAYYHMQNKMLPWISWLLFHHNPNPFNVPWCLDLDCSTWQNLTGPFQSLWTIFYLFGTIYQPRKDISRFFYLSFDHL